MTDYSPLLLFLGLWSIIPALVASYGKSRGCGWLMTFLLGVLMTPIVSLIAVLISAPKKEGQR